MERLDKIVSTGGGVSRSDARKLILKGRVYVNEKNIRDIAFKVDPDNDEIILNGEKISYCAEAVCLHSHKDTLCALWARGCAIGEMHHDNPWLLQKFGRAEKQIRKIRLSLLPYMVIKYAGYLYGKFKLKREKK